jgi:hypothetical protein
LIVSGLAVAQLLSTLQGETYEHGALQLSLEFDLAQCGWVVGLSSPPFWNPNGECPPTERVYTQVVIPKSDFEAGHVDEYLVRVFARHLERLELFRPNHML